MARCSSCKAEVRWERTVGGSLMPLDALPVPDGKMVIRAGVAVSLKADEEPDEGELRFHSHFASCPNAPHHRKTK